MASSREIVLEMLVRMDTQGSYSNILLDNSLSGGGVSPRDRGFATALFYGVLERKMTLDFLIREYSNIEFDELDKKTLQILRIGFYQLLYMNSVPDNAAVNESVQLCDKSSSGFVNAILRNFIRDGKKINTSRLEAEAKLSIEYSCPKWIIKRWINHYGEQTTQKILQSSFGRPPLYIRVNTTRTTTPQLIKELKTEGITATANKHLEDCIEIEKLETGKSIEETASFRRGHFHVQDISSQICCRIMKPGFSETIIDLCSAPGGKAFTVAQNMTGRGRLIACDMYDGKLSLLSEGAKRLGLSVIETVQNDATQFNPDFPMADRVFCDVPCSGLGIIRRKPEIKYKPFKTLEELPEIQKQIITTAAKYVKVGGTLVYSTCTLNKAENEEVVEAFMKEHSGFSPVVIPCGIPGIPDTYSRNFFPHMVGGDGFFIATFRRIV